MTTPTASRWMQDANYGRAIASHAARYSARYYRLIIAASVVAFLLLEAFYATPLILALTVGCIVLYALYVIGRMLLPDSWMGRYYTPRVQFWRAQAGMLGLTLLLGTYAVFEQPTSLWILYLLGLMIVSEHCDTREILIAIGEVDLSLIALGCVGSGLSPAAYFSLSAAFVRASIQALAIFLLGFLLHYMVRNIEARDTTIARYREMLNVLAENLHSLHDPGTARNLVLNLYREMRDAGCCSIWLLDSSDESLTLAACTKDERKPHPDCPVNEDVGRNFSVSLDDDRLPACVARTGKPHFASRADSPPRRLRDALAAPRPFLPHARLEIGVPIPDFQPHRPMSFAVLCLVFDRPMGHEEMRQEYDAAREMAHHLSPFLYYASLLEQHQALQQLTQAVTYSLDVDRVLDTLLGLVTGVFGFDFATISLVDEVEGVIRTVRGKNVSQDWIDMAIHPLDSDDIQADIVRTGRTEILTGWDARFDRQIWEQFGHDDMIRVFMPMAVADSATGEEKCIGTLEAGYHKPGARCSENSEAKPRKVHAFTAEGKQKCISRAQVDLLRPFVSQAAVAVAKARLYEQIQAKAQVLTALHHGGQAIQSAVWQHRELLKQIGRGAERVLGADLVLLFGYDEARCRAELLFIGGEVHGKGEPKPQLGEGNILDAIIKQRRPFYYSDAQQEPLLVGYGGADGHRRRTFTQRQGVVSFAGIPLLSGEELLGIMCVNYRSRRCFPEEEKQATELFAQQAAIALKNARLREQERQLAIVRERTVLSRELHHSVSSDLFAAALKARTALHHLKTGEDRVSRELKDIMDITERAKRQLGYLLSEFSADDMVEESFHTVMKEAVERIRRYYDIDVQCEGSGHATLSPHVHFSLSRIIKEALNNVIRHAKCHRVEIEYALSQEDVSVKIADDGVGFDPGQTLDRKDKMGVKNMRGYVEELGGQLHLQSSPGQGTVVSARIPLQTSSQ